MDATGKRIAIVVSRWNELVTKELLVAFALLGVVALIPIALKRWKGRHA